MQDAIAKVKSALGLKDIASHLSHFLVQGGMIMASDNRITAAAPFPFTELSFLVPGPEFERLINKFEGDCTFALDDKNMTLTLKCGKIKGTLKVLSPELVVYKPSEGQWHDLPSDLLDALRKIRPFVSDNAVHFWALSVCIAKNAVFATNNVVVARADVSDFDGEGRLLPSWAVDYILAHPCKIEALITDEGSMTFMFSDGSWMKSQLIDSKFPEAAAKLIDTLPECRFALDDEWRRGYDCISSMAENIIDIHADKMVAILGHGETEYTVNSPIPTDKPYSRWAKKFIDPVIAGATHFQPDIWPKPAPFIGPGLKGLIVGRQ